MTAETYELYICICILHAVGDLIPRPLVLPNLVLFSSWRELLLDCSPRTNIHTSRYVRVIDRSASVCIGMA